MGCGCRSEDSFLVVFYRGTEIDNVGGTEVRDGIIVDFKCKMIRW